MSIKNRALLTILSILCFYSCSSSDGRSSTSGSIEKEIDKWSQFVSKNKGLDLAAALPEYENQFSFQVRDLLKSASKVLVEYPYSLDIDFVNGEYLLLIGTWGEQYFLTVDKNTVNQILAIEKEGISEKEYGISFLLKDYKLTHFALDYELDEYDIFGGEVEYFNGDVFYAKQTRLLIWGESVTISLL